MTTQYYPTITYNYRGTLFEYTRRFGPWPLKKNGYELKKVAGMGFYKKIDKFLKLSEADKEKFRIKKSFVSNQQEVQQ